MLPESQPRLSDAPVFAVEEPNGRTAVIFSVGQMNDLIAAANRLNSDPHANTVRVPWGLIEQMSGRRVDMSLLRPEAQIGASASASATRATTPMIAAALPLPTSQFYGGAMPTFGSPPAPKPSVMPADAAASTPARPAPVTTTTQTEPVTSQTQTGDDEVFDDSDTRWSEVEHRDQPTPPPAAVSSTAIAVPVPAPAPRTAVATATPVPPLAPPPPPNLLQGLRIRFTQTTSTSQPQTAVILPPPTSSAASTPAARTPAAAPKIVASAKSMDAVNQQQRDHQPPAKKAMPAKPPRSTSSTSTGSLMISSSEAGTPEAKKEPARKKATPKPTETVASQESHVSRRDTRQTHSKEGEGKKDRGKDKSTKSHHPAEEVLPVVPVLPVDVDLTADDVPETSDNPETDDNPVTADFPDVDDLPEAVVTVSAKKKKRAARRAKSKAAAPKQTSSAPELREPSPRPPSATESYDAMLDPTYTQPVTKSKSKKTASSKTKSTRKPKEAVEQAKHRLPDEELFDPTVIKPAPLFQPRQPQPPKKGSLAAALAANASDKQGDAYPVMELLIDEDDQKELGAPMKSFAAFDYQWLEEELATLIERRNNTAMTLGVPQRALERAHKVTAYLQTVEPGFLDGLHHIRTRLHLHYPEPTAEHDLWNFGGSRVPNEYEEAAFNMMRMLAAEDGRLQMSDEVLKLKVKKYLTDGNKSRVSAADLLHHLAVNIRGHTPFFASAYMAGGRTTGIIENESAYHASLLMDLVNLFCLRQLEAPLRLRAVDICETARPRLWNIAQFVFTPSLSMLDIIAVALDTRAEAAVPHGDLRAWPPPELNPNASNPGQPPPDRASRLYLQYREPDHRHPAAHWLHFQLGTPQHWNYTAVEFALPARTLGQLENVNGKELKNRIGSLVRSFMGRRTPVWAMCLPLCRAVPNDPEKDVMPPGERSQAVREYFDAIERIYTRVNPGRPRPLGAKPFDSAVLRTPTRECDMTVRQLYNTPAQVFQQAENRVESQIPPNLLQRFDEQQCLIVAFTTGYKTLANHPEEAVNPVADGDCILTPLEVLFGNCNGVPLEYHQCDSRDTYFVQWRQQPCARISTTENIARRLLMLRGNTNVVVGWHIQTLLCALRLSLPEAVVIDLAFHPVVRRFVNHTAKNRNIPEELVDNMFPEDIVYGLDIRVVAALVSKERGIELQPAGGRDVGHELLFMAALLRRIWTPLQEAVRYRASIPAAHMVRCGHGFTPHAIANYDPDVQAAINTPSVLAAANARPEHLGGVAFGAALHYDSRIPAGAPAIPWSEGNRLLTFSHSIVDFEPPPYRIPADPVLRDELTKCALIPEVRGRELECPALRDFCHPRVIINESDVDFHNCVVSAVSQQTVDGILKHLLDPVKRDHLEIINDVRYLWFVAAYFGFLDGAFRMLVAGEFDNVPDIPVAPLMHAAAGARPVSRLACHAVHTPEPDAEELEHFEEPTGSANATIIAVGTTAAATAGTATASAATASFATASAMITTAATGSVAIASAAIAHLTTASAANENATSAAATTTAATASAAKVIVTTASAATASTASTSSATSSAAAVVQRQYSSLEEPPLVISEDSSDTTVLPSEPPFVTPRDSPANQSANAGVTRIDLTRTSTSPLSLASTESLDSTPELLTTAVTSSGEDAATALQVSVAPITATESAGVAASALTPAIENRQPDSATSTTATDTAVEKSASATSEPSGSQVDAPGAPPGSASTTKPRGRPKGGAKEMRKDAEPEDDAPTQRVTRQQAKLLGDAHNRVNTPEASASPRPASSPPK